MRVRALGRLCGLWFSLFPLNYGIPTHGSENSLTGLTLLPLIIIQRFQWWFQRPSAQLSNRRGVRGGELTIMASIFILFQIQLGARLREALLSKHQMQRRG